MIEIKQIRVTFSNEINALDIPKFRAAVIEKTERVASSFHNHKSDTEVHYRYPLIQYKAIKGKATIICLQTGVEDIHHLLKQDDLVFRIGQNTHTYRIEDMNMNRKILQVSNDLYEYEITNWLALNQKYYRRFQDLKGNEIAQIDLLTGILKGNILAFAKGIGWWIEETIYVEITNPTAMRVAPLLKKGKNTLLFDLTFKTNVLLPNYIGLGKRVSVGFGIIQSTKKNN